MLSSVYEPSAPFWKGARVCHAAHAMLWGTGTSQGAINARKSEGKGQMAGLCPCPTAAAQEHEHALSHSPITRASHTTSRFWPHC